MSAKPRILIAGCGFVGRATARVFHDAGWDVLGLTHSHPSAEALKSEPFPVAPCDIADSDAIRAVATNLGGAPDAVIHCASSGRGGSEAYREVYLEGSRNLLEVFAPGHFLFTGSTSVYGQTDGGWVNEESASDPQRETGRILLETERLVLSHGGIVARLAGIYGPGRSVLLRKFFTGEALLEGGGLRYVNQVHRDDIASALQVLITGRASGIYNVCDNTPLPQREIYEWLASRHGMPVPPSGPADLDRKRAWTNKRVNNAKLRALGWMPRFTDFFEAVINDPQLEASARLPSG